MARRRPGPRRRAAGEGPPRRGAVDQTTTDPARALPGADVLVLCAPVDQLADQARRLRPFVENKTLVMDVGSVKGAVLRAMAPLFPPGGPVFVGAHPMTGSGEPEIKRPGRSLPGRALRGDARRNPGPGHGPGQKFWRDLGARVVRLTPDAHDRAVAVVSHLPHLIADALMLTAGDAGAGPLFRLAAGSFRDATRVAGADPALWRAISPRTTPRCAARWTSSKAPWAASPRVGPCRRCAGRGRSTIDFERTDHDHVHVKPRGGAGRRPAG